MSLLDGFLVDEQRLAFWWIGGPGGLGKSRLILDWARLVPKKRRWYGAPRYDIGRATFLFHSAVEWRNWRPRRPTIVIVDDIADQPEKVGFLLQGLGQREPGSLDYPLRVLLAERSWPDRIKEVTDRSYFTDHRYRPEPLVPALLDRTAIRAMAQDLSDSGAILKAASDDVVDSVFKTSQGLPFFALLLLLSFGRGELSEGLSLTDALKEQSRRMVAKLLAGGLKPNHLPLLALAVFTRGLDWDAARAFDTDLPAKPTLDAWFHEDCAKEIPGIGPDILGERFLLDRFSELAAPSRGNFLRSAWGSRPQACALTLFKVHFDFPNDPLLGEIDAVPEDAEAGLWWGRVHGELLASDTVEGTRKDRYWRLLLKTGRAFLDRPHLQLALAEGAVNAIFDFGIHQRWEDLAQARPELRDVAERFPDHADIQQAFKVGEEVVGKHKK
ncbi:MAG: hypothetical protein EXQ89_01385 [Rhodospirillaceae bacterium]|nr:hypothetical protein [Rhodospirillaceae bacterium]